jgi:hypothetical protein
VTGNLHLGPYAGEALGNRVAYVGRVLPGGGFEDFTDCRAWRRAVAAAHLDALVVDGFARAWVRDPAFQPELPPTAAEPLVLRPVGAPADGTCP